MPTARQLTVFTNNNGLEFLGFWTSTGLYAWITWYGEFQKEEWFSRNEYPTTKEMTEACVRWFMQNGMQPYHERTSYVC